MTKARRLLALAIMATGLFAGPVRADDVSQSDERWAGLFEVGSSQVDTRTEPINWAELVAEDDGQLPTFLPPPVDRFGSAGETSAIAAWAATYEQVMRQAYAHAVLGHTEYARYLVSEAVNGLSAVRGSVKRDRARALKLIAWVERETVSPVAAHVEARIALSEGREAEARVLAEATVLTGSTGTDLAYATGLSSPARRGRASRAVLLAVSELPVQSIGTGELSLPAIAQISVEPTPDSAERMARFAWSGFTPDFFELDLGPKVSRYRPALRWMIDQTVIGGRSREKASASRSTISTVKLATFDLPASHVPPANLNIVFAD